MPQCSGFFDSTSTRLFLRCGCSFCRTQRDGCSWPEDVSGPYEPAKSQATVSRSRFSEEPEGTSRSLGVIGVVPAALAAIGGGEVIARERHLSRFGKMLPLASTRVAGLLDPGSAFLAVVRDGGAWHVADGAAPCAGVIAGLSAGFSRISAA